MHHDLEQKKLEELELALLLKKWNGGKGTVQINRFLVSIFIGIIVILGGIYFHNKEEGTQVSAANISVISDQTVTSNKKLGETLTLPDFIDVINQISTWKIGEAKILKDDRITTSFVYTFNEDLAFSGIYENKSNLLSKIILIGVDNEEYSQLMEDFIQACDPNLSSFDRKEILRGLDPGKSKTTPEIYIVKNGVIYRLQVAGNYLYFSVANDE